jgi:hypothetical protein
MTEKTSFQQKIDLITEHLKPLGFYHDYQKTQNSESYAYIAKEGNDLTYIGLYFDSYRKKITVSLKCDERIICPDYTFNRFLPEHLQNYSISMSHEKDVKKCASDIKTRIISHFEDFNKIVIEVKARQDAYNRERNSIAEDIAELKKNVGNLWKYDSDNKRDIEISKDYGSVKIETSRLNVKTLIKIVRLIDADLYKGDN